MTPSSFRSYRGRIQFLFGLAIGLSVHFIFLNVTPTNHTKTSFERAKVFMWNKIRESGDLNDSLQTKQHERVIVAAQALRDDSHYHNDNDTAANIMRQNVRVLCWIMTSPQNLYKKAIHVKNTWAKRCNVYLFFSSTTNSSFPTIGLNVSEGRQHLTAKSMLAFRHIQQYYFDKADWFMKADDDTYVIVENLRYLLQPYNASDPICFGDHFKKFTKQGYHGGGAGYVISKEALRRLATMGKNSSLCQQDGGAEDIQIAKCMQRSGAKIVNSSDAMGRSRFHSFTPETYVDGSYPSWYYSYEANAVHKGIDSISDYAISFHYVPPRKMYALEFYIYHLRPYGITSGHQHI